MLFLNIKNNNGAKLIIINSKLIFFKLNNHTSYTNCCYFKILKIIMVLN